MVFYRDRRLGFLLERIAERRPGSSTSEILALGQEVRERVCPALLGKGRIDPPPRPVLLHGDLWSGNVAQRRSGSGDPVIFDGSVYYGHGEADFGISQMFNSAHTFALAQLGMPVSRLRSSPTGLLMPCSLR